MCSNLEIKKEPELVCFKVCCVCLSYEHLYSMKEHNIYKHYKALISGDPMTKYMCIHCVGRLFAAIRFKTNALHCQALWKELLKSNPLCTEATPHKSIIDSYRNNLKYTLAQKIYEPNHADYHFICKERINQNTHQFNIPVVKYEINETNVENSSSDDSIKTFVKKRKHKNIINKEDNNRTEKDEIDDNTPILENNNINKIGKANVTDKINYIERLNEIDKINDLDEFNENDLSDVKHELEDVSDPYTSSDEALIKINIKNKVGRIKNIDKEKVNKKSDKNGIKVDRRKKPASQVLNNDIFSITDLSYEEQMNDIKRRQNSENYMNSELKCDKCYKGFVDEHAFKSHMNRHTDEGGPYQCNICEIRFKKNRALTNHVSSHVQKFSCKKCTYVTTRRHAAKLHEEYHNGTKYQCPHCFDEFSKKTTYMSHVRVKHPTDIVCELCGYSFVSAKGLTQHKKIKHRFDEQPVPLDGPECTECDLKFINKEALNIHMKSSAKHARDPNRLSIQPRRRNPSAVKKKHLNKSKKKTIKNDGPMQCEQCDMQLPDSLSYYRHFRRTHPDKNRTNYPSLKGQSMCEVCGKMFQSLALLHDHSATHTVGKQFMCTLCGKRFQRKYRLIAHRRLHVKRQRHACPVCARVFTTTSNMHRHMATHSGQKPHKCEICDKSFKLASEKRTHVTYVHLKEPWPKRAKRKTNVQNESQTDERPEGAASPWLEEDQSKVSPVTLADKPVYYNE